MGCARTTMTTDGFFFDVELLARAGAASMKIDESPVFLNYADTTTVRMVRTWLAHDQGSMRLKETCDGPAKPVLTTAPAMTELGINAACKSKMQNAENETSSAACLHYDSAILTSALCLPLLSIIVTAMISALAGQPRRDIRAQSETGNRETAKKAGGKRKGRTLKKGQGGREGTEKNIEVRQ